MARASGRTLSTLVLLWMGRKRESRTDSPCARRRKHGRQFATKGQGRGFHQGSHALPPDAFFVLMDEARKEHIPVTVHLPKGVSSAEASDAGVASLEHIETISESAPLAQRSNGEDRRTSSR